MSIIRRMSTSPYRTNPTNKPPFKVYFATGSKQRLTLARPMIERLKRAGIDVYDWTTSPTFDIVSPTFAEFRDSATRDIEAVRACDVFWYAIPEDKSEGAAVEFGVALANHKRIVVSGDVGTRNIFATLVIPELIFTTHDQAFHAVSAMSFAGLKYRGEF
jgi:hypothetical protein